MSAREVFVASTVRTAVARAKRGALAQSLPHVYGAAALNGALERVPGLDPGDVEDVVLGCAMPEGEQGLNIGRQTALRAGLPQRVAGMTVNRFCASGLQAIAQAHAAIGAGVADVMLAGGTESMTLLPMEGLRFVPDAQLAAEAPNVYISMGLTAERVAAEHDVSREDQDAFALQSHQRAVAAQDAGRFTDEIVPVSVRRQVQLDGEVSVEDVTFELDEGPRRDSTLEGLTKLRPAFKTDGTATAGNSSQMSDGAAASVLLSGERCSELGVDPIARLASFAVAGVAPEVMGMGPVEAIPKALAKAGISLADVGLIELNEAFASQALACTRLLELDPTIVNVNGGAIALGHPLGCTGAKLTASLLHEMQRRSLQWGVVSMCVGGGMGAAGVYENLRV
jgi:acetyl-CoA acyltransferase